MLGALRSKFGRCGAQDERRADDELALESVKVYARGAYSRENCAARLHFHEQSHGEERASSASGRHISGFLGGVPYAR